MYVYIVKQNKRRRHERVGRLDLPKQNKKKKTKEKEKGKERKKNSSWRQTSKEERVDRDLSWQLVVVDDVCALSASLDSGGYLSTSRRGVLGEVKYLFYIDNLVVGTMGK